jgi:hypothetical protein
MSKSKTPKARPKMVAERLAMARNLRAGLLTGQFQTRDIDAMKRNGRH